MKQWLGVADRVKVGRDAHAEMHWVGITKFDRCHFRKSIARSARHYRNVVRGVIRGEYALSAYRRVRLTLQSLSSSEGIICRIFIVYGAIRMRGQSRRRAWIWDMKMLPAASVPIGRHHRMAEVKLFIIFSPIAFVDLAYCMKVICEKCDGIVIVEANAISEASCLWRRRCRRWSDISCESI